jgi:hypothetical protein
MKNANPNRGSCLHVFGFGQSLNDCIQIDYDCFYILVAILVLPLICEITDYDGNAGIK